MTSLRGAYKAQLREGTSIANRRRSKGVERKHKRDNEVSKRRHLSNENDMSPVIERNDVQPNSQRSKRGKGSQREKADNVLDRLKQWRNEKKRQQELETQSGKSKPMFKVHALARDSEAVLFRGPRAAKLKDTGKVAPPKKQPVITKEPIGRVTRGSKLQSASKSSVDLTSKHITARTATVSSPKKRPTKAKEPVAAPAPRVSKLQKASSTLDLATKLTAAAAAKRNANTSPKKFLRATRATTLQKKESADNKKGAKALKGSSKSTGNLLTKKKGLGKTEFSPEVESTSLIPQHSTMDTSPAKSFTSALPNEVPKILADFDFSIMASSSNDSAGESKAGSSDNLDDASFAGLKLKSKRQSTRKSSRLATLEDCVIATNNIESFDDNLITFTPELSKRKSVRKSLGQHALQTPVIETMDTDQIEVSNIKIDTPKTTKRKSIRKSIFLDSLLTKSLETERAQDGVTGNPSVASKSGSVRKSTRLTQDVANDVSDLKLKATPKSTKSMRKSLRLAAQSEELMEDMPMDSSEVKSSLYTTPKSGKRKGNHKSKLFGSAASKKFDDMHISDLDSSSSKRQSTRVSGVKGLCQSTSGINIEDESSASNQTENHSDIPNTPLTSSSKRKNIRKSLSLEAALAIVQSDNSETELIKENMVENNTARQIVSDVDTQVPLVDVASTPKVLTSLEQKRKSLITPLMVSSIEGISPHPLPVHSPKPSPHSTRGTRSRRSSAVLRRRSRKSMATPVRSASGVDIDLDVSNVSTPNSVRNIENIPRRRSTVISVSDEGTAVGRELEPALAYKVEKVRRSARVSRILNELIIEKVDGEKSFFEVSIDESMKGNGSRNNSINLPNSKCNTPLGIDKTPLSTNTSPFTPRKSSEMTTLNSSATSTPLTTPKSALRTRHSMAPSSGFKEPGLPLSALRPAGSQRRKTYCTPKSKTPEQMISILKKSPMVEMIRRKSRHMSSPAPKGQYFRDLITNETERLTNLSDKWNDTVEKETGLQEEVLGQIRSTVGKALLLMRQRFKQFSGLVDNYVYNLGEKETTPTDLQGFWDMIYFQVEDVNNQFKDLEELKQSGWQAKTIAPKTDGLNQKKKIAKGKPKPKGVKSNFAAFRAELQKKKAAQTSSLTTDQMFVV